MLAEDAGLGELARAGAFVAVRPEVVALVEGVEQHGDQAAAAFIAGGEAVEPVDERAEGVEGARLVEAQGFFGVGAVGVVEAGDSFEGAGAVQGFAMGPAGGALDVCFGGGAFAHVAAGGAGVGFGEQGVGFGFPDEEFCVGGVVAGGAVGLVEVLQVWFDAFFVFAGHGEICEGGAQVGRGGWVGG